MLHIERNGIPKLDLTWTPEVRRKTVGRSMQNWRTVERYQQGHRMWAGATVPAQCQNMEEERC